MLTFLEKSQDNYFASSCEKRYKWQTQNPFIAQAERELLRCLPITPGSKVLELGCGTGSNLFNLRAMGGIFKFTGCDINEKVISLARQNFPTDEFILGDATNVTLPDESFDLVFCRDVIHHIELSKQLNFLHEMTRLVRIGGPLVVIESNGLNFTIRTFARLVKSERYVLHSTPQRIGKLIRQVRSLDTSNCAPRFAEPWNFFRCILHYECGLPGLAQSGLVRRVLGEIIRLAAMTVPSSRWAYMVFTLARRG